MLCVKPVDEKRTVKDAFEKYNIKSQNARLLLAEENGRTVGLEVVEVQNTRLNILALDITDCEDYNNPTRDNLEIAEYLIRAAGSYALNRMLLGLDCTLFELEGLLKRFNFKQNEHKISVDLKVLFKKCENCGE